MSRIELEESPLLQVRGFAPLEMGRMIVGQFSVDQLNEVAIPGSKLNHEVNELMDRHGFLVGEVMRNFCEDELQPHIQRFLNKRTALSTLLHSDMENFFLFALVMPFS